MDALVRDLEAVGARVHRDAPLALLTTLRVGGAAAILATVEDVPTLVRTVRSARTHGVPLMVLGRGSNLLVDDAGWPGIVLRLGAGFRGITIDGTVVRCGAAEPMPAVAVRTAQAGLAGFAWGCAVPGTMGGGVRMNAGAHGVAMAANLVSADVLDPAVGEVERWTLERLGLGYRRSALPPDAIVTAVTLELAREDADVVLGEIDGIRHWRREHQPLNLPSCGSVFTNPPGASAGALIEAAGLKGRRIGGAEVSRTHANFIVTHAGATAADVSALIALVQSTVLERTGTRLEPEVVRTAVPRTSDEGDAA